MRISVVGTGYVGLVSGACFAEIGHDCVCVDIDASKVERINAAEPPIHEAGLAELLRRHAGARLTATTDLEDAVRSTDVTFIAVGTPFDGERIDLGYIRQAAREIGRVLRTKPGYHVVVVKSTVVPGTTDGPVREELEQSSGKRAGADFGLGMNPEFLTEGVAVDDFMRPDRLVLGAMDARCMQVLKSIYGPFADVPVLEASNATAEMIKYASNSLLATMISFSNEFAAACEVAGGVDVADVMRGVHASRYLTTDMGGGKRVTAAISSFLWAGCGYGGSCLPKDTKALSAHSRAHGVPMPLLEAVIETNKQQPMRMLALLKKHWSSAAGRKVSVLGLAFKPDTDDMRESPAVSVIDLLLAEGAHVRAYDPVATASARAALGIRTVGLECTLEAAVDGAEALLLVTRWKEFERLPAILARMDRPPLLIDGRRMVDPGAVPAYEGVGRWATEGVR